MTGRGFWAPARVFVVLPTAYCLLLTVSGCRTTAQVIEEQRVDLGLSEGNRGYLVGTPPPAAANRQTTRKLVETVVEVPSLYKPQPGSAPPVSLKKETPPTLNPTEGLNKAEAVGETVKEESPPSAFESYVVQKGETLWSIAAKPQVFGNASKWRTLYEANRDVLKSPDRVRPGMTLRVPRSQTVSQEPAQQESSEGVTTFTK